MDTLKGAERRAVFPGPKGLPSMAVMARGVGRWSEGILSLLARERSTKFPAAPKSSEVLSW